MISTNLPNLALTYDDVNLVPKYSDIDSRSHISLVTQFTRNYKLRLPLVATPMDTVCGYDMARKMMLLGGTGCVHRFMTIEDQAKIVRQLREDLIDMVELNEWEQNEVGISMMQLPVMAAIGANKDAIKRAKALISAGVNVLLIDVAHGHHENVKKTLNELKDNFTASSHIVDIIAGSVATGEATEDLISWGADAVRVGIGGGSICSTRLKTGHGVPSLTSIAECASVADQYNIPIMTDGGIRTPGDVAKALAFGANSVMLGSVIAGTKETPTPYIPKSDGLWKLYRGSASLETKQAHGQKQNHVEGVSTLVRDKGGVKFIIKEYDDGLRSAFSYTGARNIQDFQVKATCVQVTHAGVAEARTHILDR